MTRKQVIWLLVAIVLFLAFFAIFLAPVWLWHPLGYCATAGSTKAVVGCKGYNFWSGIFSDVGEITLLGGAIAAYRKFNCGAPGCLRIGKHPTADGLHHLCKKHHPDIPDSGHTLAEIHESHRAAKLKKESR